MDESNLIEIDRMDVDAVLVGGVWYEVEHPADGDVPSVFVGPTEFQASTEAGLNVFRVTEGPWTTAISFHDRESDTYVSFALSSVAGVRTRPLWKATPSEPK